MFFRFEDKTHLLELLERHLTRLHDCCRQVWEQRRGLSAHTAGLARALRALAEAETDGDVATAVTGLAAVQVGVARGWWSKQARNWSKKSLKILNEGQSGRQELTSR